MSSFDFVSRTNVCSERETKRECRLCEEEIMSWFDGTNNVTEQVIGQCVKERYRTIRGYKRNASILNVSSLIGWLRMHGPDYNLGEVVTA